MTPENRRRLVTLFVMLVASGLLALAFLRSPENDKQPSTPVLPPVEEVAEIGKTADLESTEKADAVQATAAKAAEERAAASDIPTAELIPEPPEKAAEQAVQKDAEPTPAMVLTARAPETAASQATSLGSLDPTKARFEMRFNPVGAGIDRIVFSDFWIDARIARAAAKATRSGDAEALPPETDRYTLDSTSYGQIRIPLLAARAVVVDGANVDLFREVWTEIDTGHFVTEIVDADGTARLRIERRYALSENGYDLMLEQRVDNLGKNPVDVRWIQYGPGDLDRDRGSFIEVRRFHFGYLMPPDRDPQQTNVIAEGQLYERQAVLDQVAEWYGKTDVSAETVDLWPNETSRENALSLSWFGTTNRYFSLCVHAPYNPPTDTDRLATASIESVRPIADLSAPTEQQVLVTELHGPAKTIDPGSSANWNLGVYAGPLSREVLETGEPYEGLNMRAIIVYLMSGCCTFCTFSWLADGLVVFLTFLHSVVFDWAVAIVLLVCVVRLILHPIMRKGQIQMQRMSRLMTELKPEMDALQKKYKDDPAKLQAEQRQMFTERGVNPLGCVGGLLPTFLQMPIWIALYAVLYFAFELRQQSAFFGIFQLLPDVSAGSATLFGQFLGDLSKPDHFIEFASPVNIWITDITGFNILPLFMGVIFYIQQKYMSPPPNPNMSDEQMKQQKIMKVMMVVLFPIMLYPAPSGLTLYILTSSSIGILEGRQIRKHIDSMDLTAKPEKPVNEKRKARKDKLARMYAEKLEEAKKKQAAKRKGPTKRYKKRD